MGPAALWYRYDLCTLCLFGVLLTGTSAAEEVPTAKPEDVGVSSVRVAELSKFMRSLIDKGKIAGGVTMMGRHGKVIHLNAVGMADREAKKPMQTDAIFRIASMTKPVTSVGIMMLHEQGKVRLDDPVSKYIPEFRNPKVLLSVNPLEIRAAKRGITIRDLLTHTSGLGYPVSERIGPIYEKNGIQWGLCTTKTTLAENTRNLATLPLLFDPGEKYHYGMSMDVLGRVIEIASGTTLDRYVEDKICKPLGMNDTFFRVPREKRSRLAAAYRPWKGAIQRVYDLGIVKHDLQIGLVTITSDYPYSESHRYISGGAGLCSTAVDYMRFCQMILNGGVLHGVRLLKPETVKMMTANQVGHLLEPGGYGLGFSIKADPKENRGRLAPSLDPCGFWSTQSRISPSGDWIVVTMTQLAWDFDLTPLTHDEFARLAAEAVED